MCELISQTRMDDPTNKCDELRSIRDIAKFLNVTVSEMNESEEELIYQLKISIAFKMLDNMSSINKEELNIIGEKVQQEFAAKILDTFINNSQFIFSTVICDTTYTIEIKEGRMIMTYSEKKIMDALINTNNLNISIFVDNTIHRFRVDKGKIVMDNIDTSKSKQRAVIQSRKAKTELTPELYDQIIDCLESGHSCRSIETITGISRGRISEIARGKDKINHSHEHTAKNLSLKSVTQIQEMLKNRIPKTKIEQYTGVSKYYIKKIEKGENVTINGKKINLSENAQTML